MPAISTTDNREAKQEKKAKRPKLKKAAKRKVNVRPPDRQPDPKPKRPPTPDQADRGKDAEKRRLAPKAGDAPQTRAADTRRAENYARDQFRKEARDGLKRSVGEKQIRYTPRSTVLPDTAHSAAFKKGIVQRKQDAARRMAPVADVLEETTRPLHAVAGGTNAALKGQNVPKAALRGIQNKDKTTFSDVLKTAGVKNKTVRGIAGFGLDVALDPVTYLTAGTGSVAGKAATKAATKAERQAVKSAPAKAAAQKAEAQAVKEGAGPKAAKQAGKDAARTHARRAGKRAGEAAAQGKPTNNGLRISLAGRDLPAVTRATSAAKRAPRAVARKTRAENTRVGRSVDRAQQRVRDTSRNLASDFNPAIAPAGVDRELYQSARRSARTARAGAQRGTFRAGQRAIAFRDAIGPKNYATVIDAIETGKVATLSKSLRGPARELQRDFARMRKAEVRSGLKVGDKGETYVKHLRIRPEVKRGGGTPAVGSKKVAPGFAKGRIAGTVAQKNAREPGAYSENVADIYLNRGAESAVAQSKAKLNQAMVNAGRKPDRGIPVKEQLDEYETLYKVDGSDLVKVDPKSQEARALPKGTRYVILNEKLISRTRGTVGAAAERSTAGVFFDRAQGVWKLAATQVNPGYHVRNFAGEMQNAYLAENPIKLGKNAVQAARALRQLGREEDALRVLGKTPKDNGYGDFIRTAENVGAVRAGQLGREVQDMLGGASAKAKPAKARKGRLRKPARVLKNVEDVFRLATYKGGIDRGLSPEMAMERASRNHFDYGDLTPLERKVMRRVAPFWTFSARNIPLQARTLLTRPGKFANYQKVREELQNAFGVPDDWEQDLSESEQRAAPMPVKIGGKTYNISLGPSGLPLTDLNEFPSAGDPIKQADEWMERAVSMLTPAAKTPLELWANMSFFFRDQIEKEDAPLVPAPSWVSAIPEKYRKQLGITDKYRDPRSGKSGWGAPAKIIYALNVLPGPASFGNRLSTESDRPGQSKTAKTIQYLGPRVKQNDPVTVKVGKLYEERGKVAKKIKTLGQQNHPKNGIKISADNPTPEYRRLLDQQRALTLKIALGKVERGDKDVKVPGSGKKLKKPAGFDFGAGGEEFDFSGGGSSDFNFGG